MDSRIDKRRKHLTILLIPDDDTEPFSLNLTLRFLKIIAFVAVLLLIHIIMGGIFYWRYAVLNRENQQITKQNVELKQVQEKVYKIVPELAELQKKHEKMLNALGIKPRSNPFSHLNPLESARPFEGFGGLETEEKTEPLVKSPRTESLNFLKEEKSQYHDFVKNMPTWLPVNGYMSQDFSGLTWLSAAKYKSHLGIDIVAEVGAPIYAAGDGFVVFSDWTFPMGNLIIIYHGSGFFTYYGHNERNLVLERTFVRKGEVIGWVGSSGQSSGPHLHFEIWRHGVPLDPKEILLSFQ